MVPKDNASDLHQSVLADESISYLLSAHGAIFLDATLGMGGHSEKLLLASKVLGRKIKLYGLDQDAQALRLAEERLEGGVELMWGNFADLKKLLKQRGVSHVSGVLMDLGVSSFQIDTPERGFSFTHDGYLDMRMNEQSPVTAATIVNTWPEMRLADMIYEYGEERLSRKIAREIVTQREKEKFSSTLELAELIKELYPPKLRHKRPHPATRTFQALRIEVNNELQVLKDGLVESASLLESGGVLVVISFHSLEDRIVKHYFRELARDDQFEVVTKRPVMASEDEIMQNPRSRSAKLRVLRKKS